MFCSTINFDIELPVPHLMNQLARNSSAAPPPFSAQVIPAGNMVTPTQSE
jgi:hypothetical protein